MAVEVEAVIAVVQANQVRSDAGLPTVNPGLHLVFTGPPVQLRQWVITGQDGSQTTVILGDVTFDQALPSILFSIPAEMNKRGL